MLRSLSTRGWEPGPGTRHFTITLPLVVLLVSGLVTAGAGPAGAQVDDRPVVGPATPALATEQCPGPTSGPVPASKRTCYRVQRGDRLWRIARMAVPNSFPPLCALSDPRQVAARVRELHAENRGVIGPNPHRLRVGTLLVVERVDGAIHAPELGRCGTRPPATVTVNEGQNRQTLTFVKGDALRVELDECGPCGYQWRVTSIPNQRVFGPVSTTHRPAELPPGAVGGIGKVIFEATAKKSGTTGIEIGYFGPDKTRDTRFALRLTVV